MCQADRLQANCSSWPVPLFTGSVLFTRWLSDTSDEQGPAFSRAASTDDDASTVLVHRLWQSRWFFVVVAAAAVGWLHATCACHLNHHYVCKFIMLDSCLVWCDVTIAAALLLFCGGVVLPLPLLGPQPTTSRPLSRPSTSWAKEAFFFPLLACAQTDTRIAVAAAALASQLLLASPPAATVVAAAAAAVTAAAAGT